jgi:hypothetical protein
MGGGEDEVGSYVPAGKGGVKEIRKGYGGGWGEGRGWIEGEEGEVVAGRKVMIRIDYMGTRGEWTVK